jgi:hypothetical protein
MPHAAAPVDRPSRAPPTSSTPEPPPSTPTEEIIMSVLRPRLLAGLATLAVAALAGGLLAATPVAAPAEAAGASGAGPTGPVALDLVANGGFEAGDPAPSGWTASRGARIAADAASGARSLEVVNATGAAWEGANSDPFAVDARRIRSVRLTGQLALDDVRQGATADNAAKVNVAFVLGDGSRRWQSVRATGTQSWTGFDQTYPVPAGTVSAFASVAVDRAVGTARFDDIALEAVEHVNLVNNPGFELATPSTADCPLPAWCTPWQSSTYSVDTETVASGSRAMRIDGEPDVKRGGFVTVQLGRGAWTQIHVSARVKLRDVELADRADFPGAARVSVNFSSAEADGSTLYQGSGVLGGILTGSRDWTTLEGTFRVPAQSTRVQLIPTVQDATGSLWVDDVRVVPDSTAIMPVDTTKRAAAGAAAETHLHVTNRAATPSAVRFAIDGADGSPIQGGSVEPAVTPVLPPGGSATVVVSIPVAPDAAPGDAVSALVRATPEADAARTETARVTAVAASASTRPDEPRVYSTPSQLGELRERIATQPWAGDAFRTTVVANADAWLATPLDQPILHGGWSGDFKCPGTNTSLVWRADTPSAHRCPIDGSEHTGAKLDAAWIEIWHNNAAQAAADLALAAQVLPAGDARREAYAAKARDILVYYADRTLSVPLNVLYGRVHYQSLDEAVALVPLVDAYDLVRETLGEDDRVDIEHNLLRPLAEMLVSSPMATGNFQAWTVGAVHGVGSAIDDADLMTWALDDPQDGVEFLLDTARLEDGWWWEGAASYHVYALQAITQLAMSARNLPEGAPGARDLASDPRFRSMYTTLLPYLHPDMTVPAAGDGGTWGRKFGPGLTMFPEWAFGEYRDPEFAVGLAHAYGALGQPRADRWALRYGADEIPESTGSRQQSTTFRGLGETVLRSGGATGLVPDGDLEAASLADPAAPAGWRLDGASWADAWSDDAFSGSRALAVPAGASASTEARIDGAAVDAIRIAAALRPGSDSGSGAGLDIAFLDSRGRAIERTTIEPDAAAGGWQPVGDRIAVPERAERVRFTARAGGSGLELDRLDAWSDDLLPDGGFEEGGDGWVASGRATTSALADRGGRAAKLVGVPGRTSSWATTVPLSGGAVERVELTARVQATALVPIGSGGGARVVAELLGADGAVVGTHVAEVGRTRGWADVTLPIDVADDANAVRVRVEVRGAVGIVLADDVSLAPTAALDPFQVDAVRLDHGVPGGTHGHADKLHLDLVGGGGLQSTDLGQVYGSSNADLTANWYRETVAHNTVVVDGRSQDRSLHGELIGYGAAGSLQSVDARVDSPYRSVAEASDVDLRRQLLVADGYAIDVLDASGSDAHTYDQSWHGEGGLRLDGAELGAPSCGAPGCALDPDDVDFGYDKIRVDGEAAAAGGWVAEWATSRSVLTLRSLDRDAGTLIRATAPGVATTGEPLPFLLVRREAESTRYTTLVETRSTAESSAVRSAERIADGHVRVARADGATDDLLFGDVGSGSALVRSEGRDATSIDVVGRSSVELDGRTLLRATSGGAPWVMPSASVDLDGSTLRLDLRRSSDGTAAGAQAASGTVVLEVRAAGVRSVELDGRPATFTRSGSIVRITVEVG